MFCFAKYLSQSPFFEKFWKSEGGAGGREKLFPKKFLSPPCYCDNPFCFPVYTIYHAFSLSSDVFCMLCKFYEYSYMIIWNFIKIFTQKRVDTEKKPCYNKGTNLQRL